MLSAAQIFGLYSSPPLKSAIKVISRLCCPSLNAAEEMDKCGFYYSGTDRALFEVINKYKQPGPDWTLAEPVHRIFSLNLWFCTSRTEQWAGEEGITFVHNPIFVHIHPPPAADEIMVPRSKLSL
jgi:hypothetical protein